MTVAAIYVRQSVLGIPVEEQVAACRKDIRASGWEFGHIYSDDDRLNKSPGMAYHNCLRDMRNRKMGVLVAHSAERLFRDLGSIEDVIQSARKGNVILRLCSEGISTHGVHGAYLVMASRIVTSVVRARQSEAYSEGARRRKARGLRVGRPPKLTPELDAHIEELLEAGVTRAQIERDLSITRSKVRSVYDRLHNRLQNNKDRPCTP